MIYSFKKYNPLLLGFIIVACANVASAGSGTNNKASALVQVQVNFNIVIAPSLSIDATALSTASPDVETHSSGLTTAITPVKNVSLFILGTPVMGEYILTEPQKRKSLDTRPKGLRQFILCSP